ncbi:hypothetical protein D3C79_703100 [compost metagenome]
MNVGMNLIPTAINTYLSGHIAKFDCITNKVSENNGGMILIGEDMCSFGYSNFYLELFCLYLIGKQYDDFADQWFDQH